MKTINEVRTNYPTISLKRICDELNLCYQYVLKASKTPQEGKPYSAEDFNDEAVNKILQRKGVNLDSVDWEAISMETKSTIKVGKPEEFTLGVKFKLRETKEHQDQGISPIYTIVYLTETHVVFQADGDTQPRVMNWDTFLHQSPRITKGE